MIGDRAGEYLVGQRYLHGKTGRPVTLRYIGPLPPSTATSALHSEATTGGTTWLGIEYDDPAHGKHSGTFKEDQIFQCRNDGAGAFIKASKGVLLPGASFIDALEERYGAIMPEAGSSGSRPEDAEALEEKVQLGTSGIVVDAPGMQAVRARVGRLEKLREIGLENEWVSHLGGDEAKRAAITVRLKVVHTVNLSGNLLPDWSEVANMVRHLTGLRTLVLSSSRIAALPVDAAEGIVRELESSFAGVQELHLGNADVDWDEILRLSRVFPALRVLHLHENPSLRTTSDPGPDLGKLEALSLSGSGVPSWDALVAGLVSLPLLSTLNVSRLALPDIPPPSSTASTFPCLENLIMFSSSFSSWTAIDALESWTAGKLKSLRLSLVDSADVDTGNEDAEADKIISNPPKAPLDPDPTRISGRGVVDRPIFIAKLSSLTMLNSTPVTATERRDAERAYLSYVERASPGTESTWGRYHELSLKHGTPARDAVQSKSHSGPPKRSAALKSKMINLRLVWGDSRSDIDLKILPASPISLLRKKAARSIGVSPEVTLWTSRRIGEVHERVAEIEDGQEVGWWVSDGDVVLVEVS